MWLKILEFLAIAVLARSFGVPAWIADFISKRLDERERKRAEAR
jgi:hypothetical protein